MNKRNIHTNNNKKKLIHTNKRTVVIREGGWERKKRGEGGQTHVDGRRLDFKRWAHINFLIEGLSCVWTESLERVQYILETLLQKYFIKHLNLRVSYQYRKAEGSPMPFFPLSCIREGYFHGECSLDCIRKW